MIAGHPAYCKAPLKRIYSRLKIDDTSDISIKDELNDKNQLIVTTQDYEFALTYKGNYPKDKSEKIVNADKLKLKSTALKNSLYVIRIAYGKPWVDMQAYQNSAVYDKDIADIIGRLRTAERNLWILNDLIEKFFKSYSENLTEDMIEEL